MNKNEFKNYLICPLKAYYLMTKKTGEKEETYLIFSNYQKLKEIGEKYFKKKYKDTVNVEKVASDAYFNTKIEETLKQLQSRKSVIVNAYLSYESLKGRIDFLIRTPGTNMWSPVILKSTEDVKENIATDALFCYELVKHNANIDKIYVMYMNKGYVYEGGAYSLNNMLNLETHYNNVPLIDIAVEAGQKIDMFSVLNFAKNYNLPNFQGHIHCKYCPYRTLCQKTGNLPEYSSLDLIYGKELAEKYFNKGLKHIKDLPYDDKFDERQSLQIYCEKHPESIIINRKEIKGFVKKMKPPYFWMDFEALNTMIPRMKGTSPWQFVPFQYSVHETDETLKVIKHHEYLSFENDCRKDFVENLLEVLGTEGSIIVWNKTFEQSRLKELATAFPEYADRLNALDDRYVDLMIPFEKLWIYNSKMKGKWSLKYILPSLSSEKSYKDLEITNGLETMIHYLKILRNEEQPNKDNMLAYCGLDTESMIIIYKEMLKLIENKDLNIKESSIVFQEIELERYSYKFKNKNIAVYTSSFLTNLLQDVKTENIQTEGYKKTESFCKQYLNSDYSPDYTTSNITIQDILYYWKKLPVSTMNKTMMSREILLNSIMICRQALNKPSNKNNITPKEAVEESISPKPKRGRPKKTQVSAKKEEPELEKDDSKVSESKTILNDLIVNHEDTKNEDFEEFEDEDMSSLLDILNKFE